MDPRDDGDGHEVMDMVHFQASHLSVDVTSRKAKRREGADIGCLFAQTKLTKLSTKR
jgi:hypothetical protein